MDLLKVDFKGLVSQFYEEFDDTSSKKLKLIVATGLIYVYYLVGI